jgi:hypothetical protein
MLSGNFHGANEEDHESRLQDKIRTRDLSNTKLEGTLKSQAMALGFTLTLAQKRYLLICTFCFELQSSFRILKLGGGGGGWGSAERWKEKEGHGMKIVAALWQEISVNNTSPKYICRCKIRSRHGRSNISDKCVWTSGICWLICTGQANTHPHPACIP